MTDFLEVVGALVALSTGVSIVCGVVAYRLPNWLRDEIAGLTARQGEREEGR